MPPISHPSAANRAAADLVREIRQAEAWFDRIRSFHIRLEGKWIFSPEQLAVRRASLQERHPREEITPERFPALLPETGHIIDVAFDDRRVYSCEASDTNWVRRELRVWDGTRAIAHTHYIGQGESYSLQPTPKPFLNHAMDSIPWPRAARHTFWWHPAEWREEEESRDEPDEAFESMGREVFRDHDSYVVQTSQPQRERGMYIGVADHRLYGTYHLRCPGSVQERIAFDLAAENGAPVRTRKELDAWADPLAEELKANLLAEFLRRRASHFVREPGNWYDEYAEVASGCWMPMRMGYDHWETSVEPAFLASRRELTVVAVTIDRPLPDELFTVDFREGVAVYDEIHADGLMRYPYKKNRPPEEWPAMIEVANRQQRAEDERRGRRAS